MKVLWFINSPAAAFEEKGKGTGSWLSSLDRAIRNVPDMELCIAFLYPYRLEPFKKGSTTYYPIYSGNILAQNIKRRFLRMKKPLFTDKYLELIAQYHPDIIHIHGTENSFHTILGKTDVPVVISIQGNPSVCAYRYRSGFHGRFEHISRTRLDFKSFLIGRENFHDGLKNLTRMAELEQKTMPVAEYVIGRTDWDRRITRILAPGSRYFVGNEALRDSFYSQSWKRGKPSEKLIIHTTCGNSYFKGFEVLCRALDLLNHNGLDVEWRVAGISEDSGIVKVARRFLRDHFPEKGLVLLGSIDETRLVETMLGSDIYVMPSHTENSPNSLCEAMLLGMPCIATMTGGTASLLTDGVEGLLIQDGDPWSMAGAILELAGDWDRASEFGSNARKRAMVRHDKDKIVTDLIGVYRTILAER